MPPLIPAAKLRPVRPRTTTRPPRHVLAAVIADSFDNGGRSAVADGKPFAGNAADEGFAAGRAIERDVSDDDVFFGFERLPLAGGNTTSLPPESPLPK